MTEALEPTFGSLKDRDERVGEGGREEGGVWTGVLRREKPGVPGCLFA